MRRPLLRNTMNKEVNPYMTAVNALSPEQASNNRQATVRSGCVDADNGQLRLA